MDAEVEFITSRCETGKCEGEHFKSVKSVVAVGEDFLRKLEYVPEVK